MYDTVCIKIQDTNGNSLIRSTEEKEAFAPVTTTNLMS